jgi:hypothetical protein
MKVLIYSLSILLLLISCKEVMKKKMYEEYFDMDITQSSEHVLKTKRKFKVPFHNNQVYDPFARKTKSIWYEKGCFNTTEKVVIPKLIVLDNQNTTINTSKRKKKNRLSQGLPLIIENRTSRDTVYIPLFRGKLPIIQEALNNKMKWVEIEYLTKEKMGYYNYKIFPKEYLYTKIPIYQGDIKTKLRVKLQFNDSTTIYSNTYKGYVNKRMMK